MEDWGVNLWFGQRTALYLAALALLVGLIKFYRTFRMLKVEKSLDSIPSAFVSYSLLERTHQEFVTLGQCVDGEIEQVEGLKATSTPQRLPQVLQRRPLDAARRGGAIIAA
jgi:hypothetical protein